MSRGRTEIDRERCKGCGLCVAACPEHVLSLSTNAYNRQGLPFAVSTSPERCNACQSCAITCPDSAIRVIREAGTRVGAAG